MTSAPLTHPLLERCGVSHGFGVRDAPTPPDVVRPRQVHGVAVAQLDAGGRLAPEEADAIVATRAGVRVGVVTADCVPILVAHHEGAAVAAIHAGWRGLGAGVVEAGIEALCAAAGAPPAAFAAVIGPCIGLCCYEVDAPVLDAMGARFGDALPPTLAPTRPGHARLDLGRLAAVALARAGLPAARSARLPDACTACHPDRFHSFRRDGDRAGRLVHHVSVGKNPGLEG